MTTLIELIRLIHRGAIDSGYGCEIVCKDFCKVLHCTSTKELT